MLRLAGEHVVLRSTLPGDAAALEAVFASPEVRRWWGTETPEEAARGALAAETSLVVEVDGAVAGWIQYYEETEPDYRRAGIDVALHHAFHGRGLGADAVRTLARHLIEERGHHRVVIDPRADNARAIACYVKVGFRPVGVMRRYERGADGAWHDGLLMDLLPEDLTPPGPSSQPSGPSS